MMPDLARPEGVAFFGQKLFGVQIFDGVRQISSPDGGFLRVDSDQASGRRAAGPLEARPSPVPVDGITDKEDARDDSAQMSGMGDSGLPGKHNAGDCSQYPEQQQGFGPPRDYREEKQHLRWKKRKVGNGHLQDKSRDVDDQQCHRSRPSRLEPVATHIITVLKHLTLNVAAAKPFFNGHFIYPDGMFSKRIVRVMEWEYWSDEIMSTVAFRHSIIPSFHRPPPPLGFLFTPLLHHSITPVFPAMPSASM